MAYTNSKLVSYTKLSPNKSIRTSKIKKITIHHMAGNLSVETCGNVFANKSRQASSNYGIGTDGRIGMYVEEKHRAWTSSNRTNDNQAITIEVANDGGAPNWHVSDKALAALIELCVDICKRNGIKELNYTGDATGNLTKHEYFANTTCPGPYLGGKFSYIADEVNKRLKPTTTTTNNSTATVKPYLVKITAKTLNVRKGPSTKYAIATTVKKNEVYTIVEKKGNWGKLKSGAGWISLLYTKKV
jgi:hypothetical protein